MPDPLREHFACGVRKSVDLVEVVVVEHRVQRRPRGRDVGEVDDPPAALADRPAHVHLDHAGGVGALLRELPSARLVCLNSPLNPTGTAHCP